jgi:hypothetical protein
MIADVGDCALLVILTALKNMAVWEEWDKHNEDVKARFQFSKAYIWTKLRFTQ